MTLDEKIAQLRRQAGWSQEELADRLGITRQAVSKWESGLASPDLDKIVQLSEVFGVTTDALLKQDACVEELPEEVLQPAPQSAQEGEPDAPPARQVTRAQAEEFLALRAQAAPKMALGVALCVWSPITLIALALLQEYGFVRLSSESMAGIGLCVLIVMVASAVALFLTANTPLKEYEFLEKEPITLAPDAQEAAMRAEREAAPGAARCNTIGVVLCISSVLPLFAALCVANQNEFWTGFAVCPLLAFVGVACILFVYAGMHTGAVDRLLEKGDYTRAKKARARLLGALSTVYWLVVTAIFLYVSFGSRGSGRPGSTGTWLIWAIGGILYGAVLVGFELYEKRK